ncbi:sulfotransferase [Marinobacter sp.]|uniref:sulfotransferase n=1 Tax=Marinobacter sp. TaxID=50741 RepID=UPI0035C71984
MINLSKIRDYAVIAFLKFSAPFIRTLEHLFFSAKESAKPPVFIIGAPRTGSTILYQALTNSHKVAYIDNKACAWHRNLRFGLWLSSLRYGEKPHNNFKAEHGSTASFGGHAPSECGAFWYRWLPTDRHFIDDHEVTPVMVKEIRAEVMGAAHKLQRPLLFKNLNVGQRLRLIKKAFPDAKLIFVRRDPRFVVQSILKARERLGIGAGEWWSIMPPKFQELRELPEPEMCMAQVFSLEKQIEQDLKLFPSDNVREVFYQNMSASMIQDLGKWIGVDMKPQAEMPVFRQDSLEGLAEQDLEKLSQLAAKYPFNKELFV